MRPTPLILVGAVAACSDPAIDLSLRLPDTDVDLSCVQSVRVYAWGETVTDETPNQCIVLDAPVGGFAELREAVRGKLELRLPPSGLAGIDVSGMTFGDCFGDSVFYGGAEYDGGDMVIPLVANFDCSVTADTVVKPVDYRSLASGSCLGPAGRLDRGSIHPTMLDVPLPAMVYDLTEPSALVGVDGTALFPDALINIDDESCMAVGDEVTGSIGCVYPGAPAVCATGTQLELTTIDVDFANASMEPDAAARYPQIVFASVWDATAAIKHPIQGAQITVSPADVDLGEIHYATLPTGAPSMIDLPTATATDATGMFVAYMDRPVSVVVSAAGYSSRLVTLTAADYYFGALTIVLRPQ
jgi:hypothetical protein